MRLTNKTNLTVVTAAILVAMCAQFAGGADLCTGAVDPYNIVSEKGRFYASAGRDNELTSVEFNATKITALSFRRPFDRWSEMLKFDTDANKSLDWVEAGTYRITMRKMVLSAYDANLDGKLTGAERQVACKALASGKIRPPVKRTYTPPPPPKSHSKDHKTSSRKTSSRKIPDRKPDKPRDSKSSDAAKAAQKEAKLREIQKKRDEYQARRDMAKFDKNKDGKLDGRETAERDKYNSRIQQHQSESKKRYAEFLKKYDTNHDGKISDSEKTAYKSKLREESTKRAAAAKAASQKRAEESRARSEVKRFDKNKDGKLDPQESAALNKYRDEKKARLKEYYDKYDANGDGTVSSEERKAYYQRLKEQKNKDKGENKKGERKKSERKPKPPKIKKKRSKKDR
jgi:Ca2+-binding EF-hand superfamily protein